MNYYFITGTSSGIGAALVSLLVKDEQNRISGFSRSSDFRHNHFCHQPIDLSKTENFEQISFPSLSAPQKIVLINNAGALGAIAHVGNVSSSDLLQTMNVNTLAAMYLCNEFIKAYQHIEAEKIIVNISSGAALSPYDGWAAYCASKAALDMFTRVVAKEQELKQFPVKTFAIAPGVVDTNMQNQIRQTNAENFSKIDKFLDLKQSGGLYHANDVAGKLIYFIENTNKIKDVVSRIQL